MVVPYDLHSSSNFYQNYYSQQTGNGLSVFKGATIQRGRGIGGFFSRVLRGAMPLIKSGAKAVGKQLIDSGANIARDLLEGKNLKTASIENLSNGGKQLLSTLTNNFRVEKPPRKRKSQSAVLNSQKTQHKKQRYNNQRNIFD